MPKIVVSYRRADAQAMAGRIFDRLVANYGEEPVFMDIDKIPLGRDFRTFIAEEIRTADVVLAVIGPRWLGPRGNGPTRIHDEDDPVSIEIQAALTQFKPLIPVLVDGAQMPSKADLPAKLAALATINAAEIDPGRDFRPHMDRLIRALDDLMATSAASTVPQVPRAAVTQHFRKGLIVAATSVVLLATPLVWWQMSTTPVPAPAPATASPETTPNASEPASHTVMAAPSEAQETQADRDAPRPNVTGAVPSLEPDRPSPPIESPAQAVDLAPAPPPEPTPDVQRAPAVVAPPSPPAFASGDPREEAAWARALAAGTSRAIAQYAQEFGRAGRPEVLSVMEDFEGYERAKAIGTIESLKGYEDAYPNGRKRPEAQAEIRRLVDAELDRVCNVYADQAMKQVTEAKGLCGPQYGLRWLEQRVGHQHWCRTATPDARATEARARGAEIEVCTARRRDDQLFERVTRAGPDAVYGACVEYLKNTLEGARAENCKAKMLAFDERQWELARKVPTSRRDSRTPPYERYLRVLPNGRYASEARKAIQDIQAFEAAKKIDMEATLRGYLEAFPNGLLRTEALELVAVAKRRETERAAKQLADLTKECTNYGKQAVSLAEQNLKEPCGQTGPRWASDVQPHIDWCMTAKPDERRLEARERRTAIETCTAPRREREAWEQAAAHNTIDAIGEYLRDWRDGANAGAARARLVKLCEGRWPAAKRESTWEGLTLFVSGDCEASKYSREAAALRVAKDEAAWRRAKAASTKRGYQAYLTATGGAQSDSPFGYLPQSQGKYSSEAAKIISDFEGWEQAEQTKTPEGYQEYIDANPNGRFLAAAKRQKARLENRSGGTLEVDDEE